MSAPDLDLSGRVAIVTGAARGLGRAEALALAARGAHLAVIDARDTVGTVEDIKDLGRDAIGVTADLAESDSADRVLRAVLSVYGRVDVLVNNAGVVRDRISFHLSPEDWAVVLAVNLSASFYMTRSVTQHWRARQLDGARAARVIVNTSSESGLYGNAGQANYAAAKAGVAALTLTLAAELDRLGVRVNAIAPRARTPMSVDAFGDLPYDEARDPWAPEHVAAIVAWLCSDAAREVTGQILVVHGGTVEVMRTWSPIRRVTRDADWTDADLLDLRGALFPEGGSSHLPTPIAELFRSTPEVIA